MIDGKISAASTRASNDVCMVVTASSGSCGREEGVCSARLGRMPASTRTIILVSSNSCSVSSEIWSPCSSSPFAAGWVRHRFLAMSTMTSWTLRLSVRASRAKSSRVSEKTLLSKTAGPATEGRSILFKADKAPRVCESVSGVSLLG